MSASTRNAGILASLDAECLDWLKKQECLRDFEVLVRDHCDPSKLWGYLSAIKLAAGYHKELATHRSDIGGFDRDTFDGFVGRARRVAQELERLYSSDLGLKAIRHAAAAGSTSEFRNVPRLLRLVVKQAETIYRKTAHRKRPLYDEAVAALSVHVRRITGKWHDKELASLIDAVAGREPHGADDQRSWRNEHEALLDRVSRRDNASLPSQR